MAPDKLHQHLHQLGPTQASAFLRQQVNSNAALMAVVNTPRNLTRIQLKEVKLLLDNAGFKEANLQSAWPSSWCTR
ncbi:type I restriction-modification enzyme R subunit C-terminal domain-containing protein [Aeromonas fluvialis]|uniref:type I restriction-modification enzyme R subunit C-terminal domain-containing protein n=1 Tax=Aeromonas fluvialis TaxID=591962 RepID=UPI0005A84BDB|nr:type I restriction-modification enzyme R subunit C-terminal domain-containing protein [Aeromonas fluvialis]